MERNGEPVIRELCPTDQGLRSGLPAEHNVCCHPRVCFLLQPAYHRQAAQLAKAVAALGPTWEAWFGQERAQSACLPSLQPLPPAPLPPACSRAAPCSCRVRGAVTHPLEQPRVGFGAPCLGLLVWHCHYVETVGLLADERGSGSRPAVWRGSIISVSCVPSKHHSSALRPAAWCVGLFLLGGMGTAILILLQL